MSQEISLEKEKHEQFLLSLADDFRRYYFERWRTELASQRSSNQHGLLIGRIVDLETENKTLRDTVEELAQHVAVQSRCINALFSQISSTKSDLMDITNLIEEVIEKK